MGFNTALHFAVLYENAKALHLLMRAPSVDTSIRNKEGMTPMDYALLITSKTIRANIINILRGGGLKFKGATFIEPDIAPSTFSNIRCNSYILILTIA